MKPVAVIDGLVVEGASDPISFSVWPGEIVGIAGLVGSGRSELLETILGARRARSGSVSVQGRPVTGGNPHASIKAGIAIVPEQRHLQGLILGASIRRNVVLGHWKAMSLVHQGTEDALTAQVVSRLRVKAPNLDAPMRSLSGGNQQKVVLARCLAGNPKLLLLDEPTIGVDIGAREDLYGIVAELCEAGMGVVLVSSDMTELLRLSDRVLVLHEQSVMGEVDGERATEEEIAMLAGGLQYVSP